MLKKKYIRLHQQKSLLRVRSRGISSLSKQMLIFSYSDLETLWLNVQHRLLKGKAFSQRERERERESSHEPLVNVQCSARCRLPMGVTVMNGPE